MNSKLLSAVLGSFAMATPLVARADDAAKPAEKKAEAPAAAPAKEKKESKAEKKAEKAKDAKGGEKSCGADGKSCGGK